MKREKRKSKNNEVLKGVAATCTTFAVAFSLFAGCGQSFAERNLAGNAGNIPQSGAHVETVKETCKPVVTYTEEDVIALAQMAWGEALVTGSDTEMSACMWVALNRLDSDDPYYARCQTVYDIVTQPNQFHGYHPDNPVDLHLVELARDVLDRWVAEKSGEVDVGRTLPPEFLFFYGDRVENHFTTEYAGGGQTYDWSLESPYEN